jgi:lysophospholipase L1-like esterase
MAAVGWLLMSRGPLPEAPQASLTDELTRLYEERARESVPRPDDVGWPPPLKREPIPENVVRLLFPNIGRGRLEYHPTLFQRVVPSLDTWDFLPEIAGGRYRLRTNSLGFRGEREPSSDRPDLRVIVTGASNVEGKCDDRDAAPALLEALLRKRLPQDDIEVLNAACAGYTFYNFLAILEQYAELQPDVFCLVAYGGNDFFGNLKFERWFERRLPPRYEPYGTAALEASDDDFLRQLVGVEVGQAAYYLNNPEGEQLTIDSACGATRDMARFCAERGIRFVCAYLPPPLVGQPAYLAEERRRALQLVGLEEGALEVSGRIADAWIEYCAQIGIDVIDLRPRFLEADERLYWKADIHINLAGQRVVAEALFARLAAE